MKQIHLVTTNHNGIIILNQSVLDGSMFEIMIIKEINHDEKVTNILLSQDINTLVEAQIFFFNFINGVSW